MPIARRLLALRWFSVLLFAAALAMKLAVPTGYMIVSAHGMPAIAPCPGQQPAPMAQHAMAHHGGDHGADHGGHGERGDHGKAAMPCAFAALSAGVIAAVDPLLLALLVAFVLAIGFVATCAPRPRATVRLRPPLRGPPLLR